MNKILLFFILLSIVSLAASHRHKHGKVKKIVKVMTLGGKPMNDFGGRRRGGFRRRIGDTHVHHHHHHHQPKASSSSSSSSSESREEPIVGAEKPVHTTLSAPLPTPKPLPPACEKEWLSFKRKNELWCVLVGNKGADNHAFSQAEAEKICKKHKATLTGVISSEERDKIADEALHQLGEMKMEVGAVWLGATTTPDCTVKSCGEEDTFKWTDGHTTGVAGFKWGEHEPDNQDYGSDKACIQQIVMSPTYAKDSTNHKFAEFFEHGDFDKHSCKVEKARKRDCMRVERRLFRAFQFFCSLK